MVKKTEEVVPNTEILEGIEEIETPIVDKELLKVDVPDEKIPGRLSIEWSDWLMTKFHKSELVEKEKQKFPRVHGLRRLAQLYVGDIVSSTAECASPPKCLSNGGIDLTSFIYTVVFIKPNKETVQYSDAADVYYYSKESSNADATFARFPSALAVTRAEARALRKALGLNTCSAEELAPVLDKGKDIVEKKGKEVVSDDYSPDYIDAGQVHFIKTKCAVVDIHPWKFLNSGAEKYKKLKDIPYTKAVEFCKIVGEMLRSKNNKGNFIAEYSKTNNVDLGKFNASWESDI